MRRRVIRSLDGGGCDLPWFFGRVGWEPVGLLPERLGVLLRAGPAVPTLRGRGWALNNNGLLKTQPQSIKG